jgi:hypothetical protein
MRFRLIGNPDLEQQVPKVFEADPKQGPVAVAKIRALLESFDEDPAELEPAPVSQQDWPEGVRVNARRDEDAASRSVAAHVTIYIYEAWALRFAIARVVFSSRNLCLALLAKVEELVWPI